MRRQKALNRRVFPSRRGAMDNSPFREFSIVLEAGVKILFGADKLCGRHGSAPNSLQY